MAAPARPRIHSVAVEITDSCNLQCAHCYNDTRLPDSRARQPSPELTLSRLGRLLDAADVAHVTLTGGEPLSSPSFFPAARLVRSRGISLQVLTNGTMLDEAAAGELARLGTRCVQVSLHGADAQRHDAIPEFCDGCVHAATCGGGCGAASAWLLGDARRYPDPLLWQHVDDDFAQRLDERRAREAAHRPRTASGGLR